MAAVRPLGPSPTSGVLLPAFLSVPRSLVWVPKRARAVGPIRGALNLRRRRGGVCDVIVPPRGLWKAWRGTAPLRRRCRPDLARARWPRQPCQQGIAPGDLQRSGGSLIDVWSVVPHGPPVGRHRARLLSDRRAQAACGGGQGPGGVQRPHLPAWGRHADLPSRVPVTSVVAESLLT